MWPSLASQSNAPPHNGSIMEGHREQAKELLDPAVPEVQVWSSEHTSRLLSED